MDSKAPGNATAAHADGDGSDIPETPSPTAEKVEKWKEKKKSRFSSKKSRKKKQEAKETKNADSESTRPAENTATAIATETGQQRLEKSPKTSKKSQGDEGEGLGRDDGGSVDRNSGEQAKPEHSMSRTRSTSRGRFSSLFRRKKRSQSETDISVKGRMDDENKSERLTRNKYDGGKRRNVSREDVSRREGNDIPTDNTLSSTSPSATAVPPPLQLKSSLKPTPNYYAFDPRTNPRDRLQHMTLRDAAKEHRAKRPRSLPRQRRRLDEIVAMESQSGRPQSSSELDVLSTPPGSLRAVRSSTLPRSRNASQSPLSTSRDGMGVSSSPVYPSEVDVQVDPMKRGRPVDKTRNISPDYKIISDPTNSTAISKKVHRPVVQEKHSSIKVDESDKEMVNPSKMPTLVTKTDAKLVHSKQPYANITDEASRVSTDSKVPKDKREQLISSSKENPRHASSTANSKQIAQQNRDNDKDDAKSRRKASLTTFLALSRRCSSSNSPTRRQSDARNQEIDEMPEQGDENESNAEATRRSTIANKEIVAKEDILASLKSKPAQNDTDSGQRNAKPQSRGYTPQSPPPLPMPQKGETPSEYNSIALRKVPVAVEAKQEKQQEAAITAAGATQTSATNPRFSLNDTELSTGDMIDLSSASMTSSFNPDVEEERSSISSGPQITSMTSSYRSSDQGYVDGDSVEDSDDDEDDDNSAFSTPPEDKEAQPAKEVLTPAVLHRLLQKATSGGDAKQKRFPEFDPTDQWEKNFNLESQPDGYFRRDRLSVRQGRPKSRGVQRSKSDVDRRKYVSPRTFGKDRSLLLGDGKVNAFHTPPTSTEKLSGAPQFVPMEAAYAGLTDEGDRASLTSTVTLTSLEGSSLQPSMSSADNGKADQKTYPVMGTAAQQKYRRTFSPARARKLFPLVDESAIENSSTSPPVLKSFSSQDLEAIPPSSSSFPLIPSPTSTSVDVYRVNQDLSPLQQHFNQGLKSECSPPGGISSVPELAKRDGSQVSPVTDVTTPERPTPRLLITGLEISPNQPVSPGSKSLVDCLIDQSAFKWKRRQENESEDKQEGLPHRRSFRTKREREALNTQEEKAKADISPPGFKVMEDKECQTSTWLLNDLLAYSKSPGTHKKKSMFANKKKKRFAEVSANLAPLKIPKQKDALQRSGKGDDSIEDEPLSSSSYRTPNSSGAKEGESAFMEVISSTKAANEGKSSPASDPTTPVTAQTSISREDKSTSKSPSSDKDDAFETLSSGGGVITLPTPINESQTSPTSGNNDSASPRPKKLSFTAIILLKNRLAKFRERKNREKEAASAPVTEKIEPDLPSDTFMSIENEINLSKLEISKETDIIDDDDIFEPEFSLDYPTKQLRFDPVTAGEPIQGEEPLPPLPPPSSRRLRQRRESTMRERRKRCLSYCKKFVAFLFSHIGLCSLVVAYTIMGGFIFRALESPEETSVKMEIKDRRNQVIGKIISLAVEFKRTEESLWNLTQEVNVTLTEWQAYIHKVTKDMGWDGTENMDDDGSWTFASSLLYAITVTTTIGYGHVAPKTPEGRLVTIGYAVVGIPLTLLCLTNIGDVMATGFRLLYGKVCCGICCTLLKFKKRRIPPDLEKGMGRAMVTTEEEESDKPKEVIHVPTSLCIILIAAYIFAGAIMFATWEGWEILEGSYFCFITLSTIGFGDIVPGMDSNTWSHEEKLVLCALYLVFGLSLIAMCFNLVQEDVKAKCRWLGEKLGIVEKPETPL